MKKKMITAVPLVLLGIAALIAYPVLRIRWAPADPLLYPPPFPKRSVASALMWKNSAS